MKFTHAEVALERECRMGRKSIAPSPVITGLVPVTHFPEAIVASRVRTGILLMGFWKMGGRDGARP
jgi:hypothetical protein